MTATRPLILHLTGEYPDPVRNRTTPAVKNFIDRLPDFDHLIISLKRCGDPRRTYCRIFDWQDNQKVVALGYWAPPGGILHRWMMAKVTRAVELILDEEARRPALVSAHKLTIEGVLALALKRRRGLPYTCAVRGEVEDKFFRFKPELRSLFGRVVAEAECLYYVSAWFRPRIEERYPGRTKAASLLPNFIAPTTLSDKSSPDPNALVTVMDLNVYRRKGLPELIEALGMARRVRPALRLDVIGWTSPKVQREIDDLVEKHGVGGSIRFLGTLDNAAVIGRLPSYAGFVLPARNETFGMSYVEALLAGVPIVYSRDSGIDGYLDGLDVGIGVPAGDAGALEQAMLSLIDRAPALRGSIRQNYRALQARFMPDSYLSHYRALVAATLAPAAANSSIAAADARSEAVA